MGRLSKNLEESRAESKVACGDPNREGVEGNNISNWAREHSSDAVAKNIELLY